MAVLSLLQTMAALTALAPAVKHAAQPTTVLMKPY
jgi:hypothetical protein